MQRMFIVSTHIPKTAGTTLANVMSRCYNRRIIFDYDGYSSPHIASESIVKHSDFISNYFYAIYGHFFASKYFEVFPDACFISTVRHPVDRVISQYIHELNEDSSDAWYHADIASGRMDLPTFASQAGVGDAMAVHLAGKPLAAYSLILISEQLRLSLALFDLLVRPIKLESYFGSPPALPFDNIGRQRNIRPEISDAQRSEVYNRTIADYEIYAEAVSLLESRASKFSF